MSTWIIERHLDGVEVLHNLGIPEAPVRTVRWCVPERSALVLGSAQSETDVDLEAAARLKVDIVRRRSGGGAVLVEAHDIAWCDILIPASDPLWQVDVGKAFHWLGHVWVQVLQDLGITEAQVHEGALITNEWSRKICFAGLGPGEVTVDSRKIVGISQRRTRQGAMFQCAVLLNMRAERICELLGLVNTGAAEQVQNLTETIDKTIDVAISRLEESLIARLLTA